MDDFYGIDNNSAGHLLRLRQHHDVMAMQIVNVLKEIPLIAGRYKIVDGNQQRILDTRSPDARRACQEHFGRHHQAVATIMRRHAIAVLRLPTGDDIVSAVRVFFAGGMGHAAAERSAA